MKVFTELKKTSFYWDIFFLTTFIGIWPRFIEPKLLFLNRFNFHLDNLTKEIRIVQISDLHYNEHVTDRYLRKIARKVNGENPHLILFTGDFICRSILKDTFRLKNFLQSLKASHGCFAVLGNHDYSSYVSVNGEGDYDVFDESSTQVSRGFKRIFEKICLSGKASDRAQKLVPHENLTKLLIECQIELLENDSRCIEVNGEQLTIIGLGEHMLNRAEPDKAFANCDPKIPSIVAVHNPDAIPKIFPYSANVILSGHTHGGQVNLPWFWKKICVLENPRYKKGLYREKGKWIYVSRGIGGSTPFRFFAPPEITLFTLGKQ